MTSAPLGRLSEVVLFGNVAVTTPAMNALLAEDVPLVLLRADGRPRGRLEPPRASHIEARRRQLALSTDPAARLQAARAMVRGKLQNQDILLRRRAARSDFRDDVLVFARRVSQAVGRVDEARAVDELIGIEGAAAGAYFAAIRLLVPADCAFRRRGRHEPDIVNVLVNYTSAVLRELVFGAVVAAGLDPYVSFLHTPRAGRPSLVFDLMEEWRPVLLESTVLGLLGLRTVTPADLLPPVTPADRGRRSTSNGEPPGPPDAAASAGRVEAQPADLAGSGTGPAGTGTHDVADSQPARPVLSTAATAAVLARFRGKVEAPARAWAPTGGRSYGGCVRRQALALREAILGGAPYEPFRWR